MNVEKLQLDPHVVSSIEEMMDVLGREYLLTKLEDKKGELDLSAPLLGWFDVDFLYLLNHYLIFRETKDTVIIDGYLNPILELTSLAQCLLPFREYFRDEANLNVLRGRLLSPGEGYASVRFEALIARNQKENGYEVNVRAFRGEEDFDILTEGGETSVEIECKTQSAESGQRVKMNDLLRLVDGIANAVSVCDKRLVLFLGCSDRLLENDLDALSTVIRRTIGSHEFERHSLTLDADRQYEIEISDIGSTTDPLDPSELSRIVQARKFDNPPRVAFFGRMVPQESVADPDLSLPEPPSYILSWSKKKNRPLTNLRKVFRDAVWHQFSGSRPSVVCLHLDADISWPQIMKLENPYEAFAAAFQEQPKVSALLLSGLDKSTENYLRGSCTSDPLLLRNKCSEIPLPENYRFFKDAQKWCKN